MRFARKLPGRSLTWSVVALVAAGTALADDAYYEVSQRDLKTTKGGLLAPRANDWRNWQRQQLLVPYAVLEGEGEIYLGANVGSTAGFEARPANEPANNADRPLNANAVAVRAPAGKPVKGTIFVPNSDFTGMDAVSFEIGTGQANPEARRNFYLSRANHFERLSGRNLPGAAWFRFQALESRRILDGKPTIEDTLTTDPANRREQVTRYEDTFQIFSGGRAISENLQLDRLIRPTKPEAATLKIDTLKGITVAEMKWDELTKNIAPALDPLAAIIPADQHAIFLPNFKALLTLMDEAAADGTPLLQLLQQRSEDLGSREKYQRQLCLSTDALSRLLGDKVIASVAFTGSDPYLRTGSDVAVLFESKTPAVLVEFLAAKQNAAAKANPGCQEVKGVLDGLAYTAAVTPDRRVCSYLATIDNAVVVTNSLKQLEQLIRASKEVDPPLASLPEYKFFRNRYPRANSEETGLLVVTDATIRRWCGPKWRIATSRRTRAAAILMQHQAQHLAELAAGKVTTQGLPSNYFVQDIGALTLTPEGVTSSTYGSLEFQTPISELDLTMITPGEAESYERWRNTYQQYWRQFFDPIAVSFSVKARKLAADVTVMPLISSSDYQQYIQIAGKSKIAPASGDRHDGTLFHWAMAIDTKSEAMQRTGNLLQGLVQGIAGPLSWMGETIAVYADADPYWIDLAKTEEDKRNDFFEKNAHRIPVAFRADVSSPLKLAAFLTALRTFVQQAAPNLTTWENKAHNEFSYVKVQPTNAGRGGTNLNEEFALYYAPTGKSLTVTLNEELLKRSLDREAAVDKAVKEKKPVPDSSKPWLGESLALQIDRSTVDMLTGLGQKEYQLAMQSRAWANIPILNEWRKNFAKEDPVAFQTKHWQGTLKCPGGGKYVWNEEFQTMESTVYGHPAKPKNGPANPAALKNLAGANFGVTFENQGLRARMELERKAE